MKILTNHIGYDRFFNKRAVLMGTDGDTLASFNIVEESSGKTVFTGKPLEAGTVAKWKVGYFWTMDFSEVREEGTFYIVCDTSKGLIRSGNFVIEENILAKQSLSDAIFYFKAQRCTGDLDWADRTMTFEGERKGTHDVHGGWYDATGDYSKHFSHLFHSTYFSPQQGPLTVWALFNTLEELTASGKPHYHEYKRRLIDEAMYGAEYMYRMKAPSGAFFRSVSGKGRLKKPEDRCLALQYKGSSRQFGKAETADQEVITDESYEAAFRMGSGLAIAALAAASRYTYPGEFTSEQFLEAAMEAYAYLEKNNEKYTNNGKWNMLDEYCALIALVELYKSTQKDDYLDKARNMAKQICMRLASSGAWNNYWRVEDRDRPFFHPSDAGMPVVALLHFLELEKDEGIRKGLLDTIRKSMEFELWVTREVNNPFGLARQLVQRRDNSRYTAFFFPHDNEAAPWWQGENARLASLSAAARLCARHFNEDKAFQSKLLSYADDQINWILGLNPFDSCMQQGSGRNNPPYLFENGFDYTNCPGGICNGITSGLEDEEDIALYSRTIPGKLDDNWRWAEQWLPHAAWYIYAVSLGLR
ncbi:MAG: glycoside hydrolase family 9 protein [Clostridia bacterium]|nr:glycoside hydrolase family 9 protein [Clostridia bacterium]